MSDIQVQCRYCQKEFAVSDDFGGLLATCPYCSRQVNVPMKPGQMDAKSDLHVRKGTSVAGGRCCPKCGAVMGQDAIICIQCGYDQRSGLQFSEKPEPAWLNKPRIMALAGVVILAGLAWTMLQPSGDTITYVPPVKDERPASAALPGGTPAPTPPQQAVPASTGKVAQATNDLVKAPPATPVMTEAEWLKMESDLRQKLAEQLRQMYPAFTNGESVALRRNNGMVHRGIYLGISSNSAVLLVGRDSMRVPLAVLDNSSRLRTDPSAREKLVEFHVKKKIDSLNSF